MSRPKRRSLSDSLNAPEALPPDVVSEIPLQTPEEHTSQTIDLVTRSRDRVNQTIDKAVRGRGQRRSPGDQTRHSYHASLYLPEEAQFALREIALVNRRLKPHDVMLEAMADLFERYNKRELAEECRRRITSRDKAKALLRDSEKK